MIGDNQEPLAPHDGPRRAFILGAGASISATNGVFPTIDTIFHTAKDVSITSFLDAGEMARIEDYVKRKFGKGCFDKRSKLNIEMVLTLLDIDIESGGPADYFSIKEIILKVIQYSIVTMQNSVQVNDEYRQLKSFLTRNDLVITFNWDTLLDSVFEAESDNYEAAGFQQWDTFLKSFVSGSEKKNGVDLDKFLDSPRPRPFGKPVPGHRWGPSYLKMHGSIDWVVCVNPECVAKGHLFRVAYPLIDYYCDYCSEAEKTVIVPPVLNKNLRADGSIRRIWNSGIQSLREAEEIIIWGYGLPPTDFYAENLLRFARSPSLKKVTLVNPAVESKRGRTGAFVRKFEDILGVKAHDGLRWYRNFQDWSSDTGNDVRSNDQA